MRNHVSKVLVGTATANTSLAPTTLAAITAGQLIAFDFDTRADITAATTSIGFAKGTAKVGEPVIAGPIPKSGISSIVLNPYQAAVNQTMTLTVTTVPEVGKTALFKVVYLDNLSILPNKMKQTVIGIEGLPGDTTTTVATRIAAEFNKQEFKFVTVTSATNVVTFVAQQVSTASAFNGIDRPEVIKFTLGSPDDSTHGTYTVAQTVASKSGQGDAAKVAWVESQSMGRRGYSDRRMWNDTKKFRSDVAPGETYANIVITADILVEGDMQGVRSNPIGVSIFGSGATLSAVVTDLAVASIVPTTVAAS